MMTSEKKKTPLRPSGEDFVARAGTVHEDDMASKRPSNPRMRRGTHHSTTEGDRSKPNLVRRRIAAAKGIVALLLLVLFVVLVIRNSQPVVVDFIFVLGRPRLIWVILACAALGGVIGYLLASHDYVTKGSDRPRSDEPR